MESKYQTWIDNWLKANVNCWGKCRQATQQMKEAFPELRIVAGIVITAVGDRQHFWCCTSDGSIVDPTRVQFIEMGIGIAKYEEWTPEMEICVGKCMDCGMEIYETVPDLNTVVHKNFCSERCERSFTRDLYGSV